ncbi:MAG: Sec-independent protein translocase protein TatB [Pseudomonadota bacterium]
MFDIGGWEILLLAALALIVVGPKDLPSLVRNVGRWVAKARGLAREFQQGMEEAARDAELDDIRKVANVKTGVMDEVKKFGSGITSSIEKDLDTSTTAASQEPKQPPTPVRHPDLDDTDLEETDVTIRRPSDGPEAPQAAPAANVNGPATQDDDAFLEKFQREVGYARRDPS